MPLFRRNYRRLALLAAALGLGLSVFWAVNAAHAAVPPSAPSLSLLEAIVDEVIRLFLNL